MVNRLVSRIITFQSVFGWMVAEGLTMYNQTVLALQSYGKRSNNYICVLASSVYGMPWFFLNILITKVLRFSILFILFIHIKSKN